MKSTLIFCLFVLTTFNSFSQNVFIREYYSHILGDTVNGDTIEVDISTGQLTLPLYVQVETDSAYSIRYTLTKIQSDSCITTSMDIVFEPDVNFQSMCVNTTTYLPDSQLFSVQNPSDILYFNSNFIVYCNACVHYRYKIYINENLKDSVDLKVCGILGLNDVFENDIIQLFPNPVDEILTVNSIFPINKMEYTIVDVTGKIVLKGKFNDMNQITISNLEKGIYSIQLKTVDKRFNSYLFLKN